MGKWEGLGLLREKAGAILLLEKTTKSEKLQPAIAECRPFGQAGY